MAKVVEIFQLEVSSGALPQSFQGSQFQAHEKISEPFSFVLTGAVEKELNLEKIIGESVSLETKWGDQSRFFHGDVGSVEERGTTTISSESTKHVYQITLYPRWWFLKHSQNCCIFQEKSAVDIIKEVLKGKKVSFADKTKSCGKRKRDFCIQYNESDFDFVSRLMEEEGIFYFFTHSSGEHKMVLADDPGDFGSASPSTIEFNNTRVPQNFPEKMIDFQQSQKTAPASVSAKDFMFQTPDKKLTSEAGKRSENQDVFQYPGGFPATEKGNPQSEGDQLSKCYLEALQATRGLAKGKSTVLGLYAGAQFTLKGAPVSGHNKKYSLFEVKHFWNVPSVESGEEDHGTIGVYHNQIISFDAQVTYRPLRRTPKPRIWGTQTAIVTGKDKKEIWTDEWGRITVKFHWDQRKETDEKSSCWIRVATPLAGQGWGMVHIPRVGQEVVVSFLDGDPDRPIVVGCVFNGHHKPPYELPKEATKSTFKSQTSPAGKEKGFNEIRFEDKEKAEEVYIHAQKDAKIDVQDSCTTDVYTGSHTTVIHRGDRSVTLKGEDKPTSGQGNDKLVLTKGNQTTTLSKGNQEITLADGNQSITLKKGDQTTTLSNGKFVLTVSGGSITIEAKGSGDVTIKAGGGLTLDAGGKLVLKGRQGVDISSSAGVTVGAQTSLKLSGKAGASLTSNANASVSGTVGLKLDGGGGPTTVKGVIVKLN